MKNIKGERQYDNYSAVNVAVWSLNVLLEVKSRKASKSDVLLVANRLLLRLIYRISSKKHYSKINYKRRNAFYV